MRVRARLLVGVLVVGGVIAASAPAWATSPSIIVLRLASAINRGDVAAAEAVLADNITWVGCGDNFGTCHGKAEVVAMELQPDAASHSHVVLTGLRSSGDTVTARFLFWNDEIRSIPGVHRVTGPLMARVANDQIWWFQVSLDPNDAQNQKFFAATGGGATPASGATGAAPSRLAKTGDGSLASGSTLPAVTALLVALTAAGVFVRRRLLV